MYSKLEEDLIFLMKYLSMLTGNGYLDKNITLKYLRIINNEINNINNAKDKKDYQTLEYSKIDSIINDDDKLINYLINLPLDEEMMRKRSKVIISLLGNMNTSLEEEINNILNVMKEEENDKYFRR